MRRGLPLASLLVIFTTMIGCDAALMLEPFYPHMIRPRPRSTVQSSTAPTDDGWRLLARRDAAAAHEVFEMQMLRRPGEGTPIIGASLAMATRGDLRGGADLMRSALRVDPEAMERLRPSRSLQRQIDELAIGYEHRLTRRGLNPDDVLMMGSLAYLAREREGTKAAVAACHRLGDRSAAVRHLGALAGVATPAEVAMSRPLPVPPRSADTPSHASPASIPGASPSLVKPARTVSAPSSDPDPTESDSVAAHAGATRGGDAVPPEPVDYDALRRGILEMSDVLDRFNRGLLEAMEETSRSS